MGFTNREKGIFLHMASRAKIADPILVTGPPRSGTSVVAGLLHLAGAWVGQTIGPHPESPKGFFENTAIKQQVFEPYLFGLNVDLLGKRELPKNSAKRRIPKLREQVHAVLVDQEYAGGPWLYKNPMISIVWQAWHAAFPGARWVLVRRDPMENAAECVATSWMGGLSTQLEWLAYLEQYTDRLHTIAKELPQAHVWVEPLSPEVDLGQDMASVAEWLELDVSALHPKVLDDFIVKGDN